MDLYKDLLAIVLVAICGALILSNLGCSQPSDEEITAAAERDAYERKITFTMPLEYSATTTKCDMHRECRTRYYHPRGNQ